MWASTLLVVISMLSARAAQISESIGEQVRAAPSSRQGAVIRSAAASPSRDHRRRTPAKRVPAPAKISPIRVAPALVAPPVIAAIKIAAPANDAKAVIEKVQNFYNTTKSFTASFSQTVRNSTFGKLRPQVSSGKVFILKPGKMRWDYKNKSRRSKSDPKVSKSFISDGKHLWAVMHKNKQYYKQTLDGSALPVAVSFLMGKGNLLNDFDAALDTPGKYGSESDILLLLTPKVPSARYKKLWLVVDPVRYSVKQSVVLNSKGDTNSIVFSHVAFNSGKLRDGHFIFNAAAHKDYRLITPPKQ